MTNHLQRAKIDAEDAGAAFPDDWSVESMLTKARTHALIALTEQATRIANALEGSPAVRGSILPASETSEVAVGGSESSEPQNAAQGDAQGRVHFRTLAQREAVDEMLAALDQLGMTPKDAAEARRLRDLNHGEIALYERFENARLTLDEAGR